MSDTIKQSGIEVGMCLREEVVGTNAVSMAIRLKKTTCLLPHQHYCDLMKNWSCLAVPLLHDEKVIGCLAVCSIGKALKNELIAIAELLAYQVSSELKTAQNVLRLNSDIKLGRKQFTVLRLLAKGLTDGTIALELGINLSTVKYHKNKIFKALKAECRIEAVIRALKLGVISLDQIDV